AATLKTEAAGQPQTRCRVRARHPVVCHYAPSARKRFRAPGGEGLGDVENSKKYKTREKRFPPGSSGEHGGAGEQGQPLSRDLVHYHLLRVFFSCLLLDAAGGPDARGAQQDPSEDGVEGESVARSESDRGGLEGSKEPGQRQSRERSPRSGRFGEPAEACGGGEPVGGAGAFRLPGCWRWGWIRHAKGVPSGLFAVVRGRAATLRQDAQRRLRQLRAHRFLQRA